MTGQKFEVCDRALASIRRLLSLPPPEATLWRDISSNDRVVLLMAAGISDSRAEDAWVTFTTAEQTRIHDKILTFGKIAVRLKTIKHLSIERDNNAQT